MMGSSDRMQTIVLLSGGIDSTACAGFYIHQGFRVKGLFVDYSQPAAKKERIAAIEIAKRLAIPLQVLELEGEVFLPAGCVPGRNAFLILASLLVLREARGIISLGIHSGTPYFDCSPEFLVPMQRLLDGYTSGAISVGAPFVSWTKLDVWMYANMLGLPLEVTYSCELGAHQPCGNCRSCADLEALHAWKINKPCP